MMRERIRTAIEITDFKPSVEMIATKNQIAFEFSKWLLSQPKDQQLHSINAAFFGLSRSALNESFALKLTKMLKEVDLFIDEPSESLLSLRTILLIAMNYLDKISSELSNLIGVASQIACGPFAKMEPLFIRLALEEFSMHLNRKMRDRGHRLRSQKDKNSSELETSKTPKEQEEELVNDEYETLLDTSDEIYTKEIELSRSDVLSEELNLLWWLYHKFSETFDTNIANLTAAEICVSVGREVAMLSTVPTSSSSEQLVIKEALSRTAKKNITLGEISRTRISTNILTNSERQAIKTFPQLFPLYQIIAEGIASESVQPDQLLIAEIATQMYFESLLLKQITMGTP